MSKKRSSTPPGQPARNPSTLYADEPIVTTPCRECNRIVSGFPGDFARCSHCRTMTTVPGDPPPGWRLVEQPDKLIALPFYFIIAFYATIVAIWWTGGGQDASGRQDWVGSGVVVAVFALWIYTIMQFAWTAERQRGWWRPVIAYHVASLIAVPCFVWLAAAVSALFSGSFGVGHAGRVLLALILLLVCMLLYGAARRRLAHLRITKP